MADCATLLRDHVTLKCRCIDRIFLQAYVPKLQVGGASVHLPALAKEVQDSLVGGLWENWGGLRQGHPPVCPQAPNSRGAVREGTGQGGGSSPLSGSGSPRRSRPGGADRDRPGESFGVAIVAAEGAEESRPCPYGLGPPDGLHQSFLFLRVGWGMGRRLLEDQRLCPFPIWLWLNGHEWAKRQPAKAGISYEALDNGLRCCADPTALQNISSRSPTPACLTDLRPAVGESANRCLCDAEAADAQPAPDVATFCQVTRPSTTEDGLYAPGLRFGEARVMSLLGALVGFCHLVAGFCNHQIVERVRALGAAPYTARQATYDLRRLKRKGLIVKLPRTHRYQLTGLGRRVAVLFTRTYGRVLAPGLSALDPRLPEDVGARSPLTPAWRSLERTLDDYIEAQLTAT
jgi:hypothetical protein